ncbi:S8 family serine peptidase [Lignipirellula cremea]|uniref:Subtilisin amylosacchariticus n=1 Tax=Lignipirellula cremea TaxID=2528010 RepID=A0A518E4N4_9BACT|nr:S8 family serine peptidase [Lignipirellula cremea]QDU99047.1 Subtilisin amylosacchariticus precursor [Lignipirellula cremea]
MPRPRSFTFEKLEEKLALTAQALTSISDEAAQLVLEQHVTATLAEAHDETGVSYVHETYGFTGQGQTVAVIDSGIAWDHYALGGGYGEDFRVVGGFDFAEGDNDPFDDGPIGFHGTHVSGIIGSSDKIHTGVAPGVDLAGLRVFDDLGNGNLKWVEEALQWVHENRHTFASEITTVNLSLGVDWNSDNTPSWATLEEEFALLEKDGIFISVSAGNAFAKYGVAGVSYPAASQYVTPVASVGPDGELSDFSQRNDRVIAAPGEKISSTVPASLFGLLGPSQNFAQASGTSMAAPYVAGASTLVREAMEFAGYGVINQDVIYDHIRETADLVYDSATNAYYHRLNLGRAIDQLLPDDYGSSTVDAYAWKGMTDGASLKGSIERLADKDYFTFTATQTGTAAFALDDGGHASWIAAGGTIAGDLLTLDVKAGSSYVIGVQGDGSGLSHYVVDVTVEAAAAPMVDWGMVAAATFENEEVAGEKWFTAAAAHNGVLTVEATFAQARGDVSLRIYDAEGNLLQAATDASGYQRVDVQATAGGTYQVQVVGTNTDVDFRTTNLVQRSGSVLTIHGTSGNEVVTVSAAGKVAVHGVSYQYASGSLSQIRVDGAGGQDKITLTGTSGSDTAELRLGNTVLSGAGYSINATRFETVVVNGAGGDDTARLYDTSGADVFTAAPGSVKMQGPGYLHQAVGFEKAMAYADAGGIDAARFYDSTGNDRFVARANLRDAFLTTATSYNYASGFESNAAFAAKGGNDTAEFFAPANDFQWSSNTSQSRLGASVGTYQASAFDSSNLVTTSKTTAVLDAVTFGGDASPAKVGAGTLWGDDYIAVDSSQSYQLSGWAQSGDGNGGAIDSTARQYLGFASYDADGNLIEPLNVVKNHGATDTSLARDLKPGDRYIYLNDATGWSNGGADHTRSLAWYGYTNKQGETYDDFTYTRNVLSDAWDAGDVNLKLNRIELKTAWTGPALSAGDAIRNAARSATYNYAALSSGQVGQEWTQYSATVQGEGLAANQFRPGTEYIKVIAVTNYGETGPAANQINWSEVAWSNSQEQEFHGGQQIDLRASSEKGDIAYSWTQTSGPVVALANPYTSQASFTTPRFPIGYELEFEVSIAGSRARTETVSITVDPPTSPGGGGVTAALDAVTFRGDSNPSVVGRGTLWGDDYIAIDSSQSYQLSGWAQSGDGNGGGIDSTARQYLGFASYDVDGNLIHPLNVLKYKGAADTSLASDLKPGDRYIYLNDASGWSNGGADHTRSLAWYGYTNGQGETYDDFTYTRNVLVNAWDAGDVNLKLNRIELKSAWAGPALSAGDAIRNAASSATYNYAALSGDQVGSEWTQYSASIQGEGLAANQFRPGTEYIRVIALTNYYEAGPASNQINWSEVAWSNATPQTFYAGEPVDLQAADDGPGLSYRWTQVSGPTVALDGTNTDKLSFTAPNLTAPVDLQFQVDIKGGIAPVNETVFIRVLPQPAPSALIAALAETDFDPIPNLAPSESPWEEAAVQFWTHWENQSQLDNGYTPSAASPVGPAIGSKLSDDTPSKQFVQASTPQTADDLLAATPFYSVASDDGPLAAASSETDPVTSAPLADRAPREKEEQETENQAHDADA